MINTQQLHALEPVVDAAIKEVFDCAIKNRKNPGDFLLFLENGYFYINQMIGWSPYVIGQGLKGIQDWDRQTLIDFYYRLNFESEHANRAGDARAQEYLFKNSLHFDLMIYSHAWESYQNLAKLKQLANLCSGVPYDWSVEVPDFTRHEFIRKQLRDIFSKHRLLIGDLITRSYHSQLRNAFAHSDYSLFKMGVIELHNYHGETWEMREISYADWNERFSLTILLFNLLSRNIEEYKRRIGTDSTESKAVWIPTPSGHKLKYLWYDDNYNRFVWEENINKSRTV